MNTPFYLNPDVLGRRHLSKYDALMFMVFMGMLIWGALAFRMSGDEQLSISARIGVSLSYAGMMFGVFAHLAKQILKADEFAQLILAKSIAQAGLFAVIFVCGAALFERTGFMTDAFGKNNNAAQMWAVLVPAMFLWFAYATARQLTRQYNREEKQ